MNNRLIITDGTDKVISFHYYDLDEKDELEIVITSDIDEKSYINLTSKQQRKLYKFLKKRNEN